MSYIERRLVRTEDIGYIKSASLTLTIPIGGGRVTGTRTLADFGLNKKIEYIIDVEIDRGSPIVNDVYEPSYGITPANTVGITLAAGTGTTLTANILVMGQ